MSIRAFIAINPDETTTRRLQHALEPVKQALAATHTRWVAAENWHLTLHFLGNIEADIIPAIKTLFTECVRQQECFPITITALVPFPSRHRPRMIAADIEPTPPLMQLQQRLGEGLAQLGFEPEQRRFRPHITLARLPFKARFELPTLPTLGQGEFQAKELILYASELSSGQPVYTPMLVERFAEPCGQ